MQALLMGPAPHCLISHHSWPCSLPPPPATGSDWLASNALCEGHTLIPSLSVLTLPPQRGLLSLPAYNRTLPPAPLSPSPCLVYRTHGHLTCYTLRSLLHDMHPLQPPAEHRFMTYLCYSLLCPQFLE